MQKRNLGGSGIEVGAIGLGCMVMSWLYEASDESQSIDVIHRALDLGTTLFDTADVYGPYENELLLGKALKGRREQVVLATKCGLRVDDSSSYRYGHNGTPEHILESCEGSLRRLGVETIDLYQLHRVDPEVPIEESVGAMAQLVRQGKVRAIGLSEVSVETIKRATKVHPISSVQSEFSLWTRDPLSDVIPWCQSNNVAFIPYAPLGRGFLTGRFTSSDQIQDSDFRSENPRFQQSAIQRNLRIVKQIAQVAHEHGATEAQIALAWLLAKSKNVIPIPGTNRVPHLEENVGALKIALTPEEIEFLDRIPEAEGERY